FCSHFRVLYLMVESINSYGFVSYSDTLVPCTPDLVLGSTTYMGENCPSNSSSPRYTLCTSNGMPLADESQMVFPPSS
ncbi:hypothetical protein ILUMI_17636, partial [Ignelater luminosus]